MISYEKLYEDVKNSMSEERFRHTLGVVERAAEYAQGYNVNAEDARIAAVLHDIAKKYSPQKSYEILEK